MGGTESGIFMMKTDTALQNFSVLKNNTPGFYTTRQQTGQTLIIGQLHFKCPHMVTVI